jgi:hypothetical protein
MITVTFKIEGCIDIVREMEEAPDSGDYVWVHLPGQGNKRLQADTVEWDATLDRTTVDHVTICLV